MTLTKAMHKRLGALLKQDGHPATEDTIRDLLEQAHDRPQIMALPLITALFVALSTTLALAQALSLALSMALALAPALSLIVPLMVAVHVTMSTPV